MKGAPVEKTYRCARPIASELKDWREPIPSGVYSGGLKVSVSAIVSPSLEFSRSEIAALMAPREIVSLTKLPVEYAYTASIYGLYGNKRPFRQAGDLGQALEVWKLYDLNSRSWQVSPRADPQMAAQRRMRSSD